MPFCSIDFADQQRYLQLYTAAGTRAADYSFTNLWGWADHYGLEWQFCDSLCWIRQTKPEVCYWAPIGDWKNIDWTKQELLTAGNTFIRVPEELSNLWAAALPGRVTVEETRGQWDYLYKTEELATLPGNRFHKKKNHLNQFRKQYPGYVYQPISVDCVESVLKMQEEWCQWNECTSESLMAENDAIARILHDWDSLPNLTGGFIGIDGKVVAYTVGEALTDDTLVVHFEKGTTSYRGIYQAINSFFAQQEKDRFTYFNREQDLDDEGLRRAKESYNPVDFVKKNTVIFR